MYRQRAGEPPVSTASRWAVSARLVDSRPRRSAWPAQVEVERVQDPEYLLDVRGRVSWLEPGQPGTRDARGLGQLGLRQASTLPLGADLVSAFMKPSRPSPVPGMGGRSTVARDHGVRWDRN